jgi:hypothetical protein
VNVREVVLRPVGPSEERQYQALMETHRYLGSLPKIGETLWYLASWHDQWVALNAATHAQCPSDLRLLADDRELMCSCPLLKRRENKFTVDYL